MCDEEMALTDLGWIKLDDLPAIPGYVALIPINNQELLMVTAKSNFPNYGSNSI